MGHKKYRLVGDVEWSYKGPPQDFLKSTLSIDFYALSDETCCQKQITGNIDKIAIFKMATMRKMPKNVKWEFPKILTITDK